MMLLIFFVAWIFFFSYCLVCIFIPEIRLLRWQEGGKFGTLSHAALTFFCGSPLLIMGGVVSDRYSFLIYCLMCFAVCLMFVGFFVDSKSKKSLNKP